MPMNFQVAKVASCPLLVNKINFDYLIYKTQDTDKVFENINLQHLTLKRCSNL